MPDSLPDTDPEVRALLRQVLRNQDQQVEEQRAHEAESRENRRHIYEKLGNIENRQAVTDDHVQQIRKIVDDDEFKKDMVHLRAWRTLNSAVATWGAIGAISLILTLIGTLIVLGFNAYMGRPPP